MQKNQYIQKWYIALGIALSVLGVLFLGLTAYFAWFDMNASATICGAVAFACLIVSRLDYLEVFEMLGLKAKFKENVSRSEAMLNAVRNNAINFVRSQFRQMAREAAGGRGDWRTIKSDHDQLMADAIEMGVESSALAKMNTPLIRSATHAVATSVQRVILRRHSIAVARPRTAEAPAPSAPEQLMLEAFFAGSINGTAYVGGLRGVLTHPEIPTDDRAKIMPLIDRAEALTTDMWSEMRLTDDVVAFLSSFDPSDRNGSRSLHSQIFPEH